MRIGFFVFCGIMLSINVAFCQKGSVISRNPNGVMAGFFPLSVGNRWEYNVYMLDSNGVKVPNSDNKEYDTVTGITQIGGRPAYVMHEKAGDSVMAPSYYSFDGDGNLWTYVLPEKGKRNGYWTVYAALGDTATGALDTFFIPAFVGDVQITDTLIQIYHGDGPIDVPAGSFTGHMMSYMANSSFNGGFISGNVEFFGRLFFARGVGKIKGTASVNVSSTLMNEKGGVYMELVSYSVK